MLVAALLIIFVLGVHSLILRPQVGTYLHLKRILHTRKQLTVEHFFGMAIHRDYFIHYISKQCRRFSQYRWSFHLSMLREVPSQLKWERR